MSATTPGRQVSLSDAFERAAGDADSAESEAAVQADPEAPDCHHADVWAESGVCMACEPATGAAADVATKQQLGDDAGGGRL